MVYLHDNGYLLPAGSTIAEASTTEVPELVGKTDSLEQTLKKVEEMVGKIGIGRCICLVCGCVNVTIFIVMAIFLVVAFVFK